MAQHDQLLFKHEKACKDLQKLKNFEEEKRKEEERWRKYYETKLEKQQTDEKTYGGKLGEESILAETEQNDSSFTILNWKNNN